MRLPNVFQACFSRLLKAGGNASERISTSKAPLPVTFKGLLGLCLLATSALGGAQAKPVSPVGAPILQGSFGPPSEYSVYAPNGQFEAVTTPKKHITTVYRLSGDFRRKQWQFSPPLPVLGLSNDGEYLVTGYGNALPAAISLDQPFLWAYKRGVPAWTIPVHTIAESLEALQCQKDEAFLWGNCSDFVKDDSLLWGTYEGFRKDGRFWIETRDHRRFGFDAATGSMAESDRARPSTSSAD
jgi:hypothetical protein